MGVLLAAGFLLVTLAPAAPAAAGADPVFTLWLSSGALTATRPTATADPTPVSIVHGASSVPSTAPGVGVPFNGVPLPQTVHLWGAYVMPSAVTFTSGNIVTLYLTANKAAVLTDVWAQVSRDATSIKSASRGAYVDTNSTHTSPALQENILQEGKALKVEIPLPTFSEATLAWAAGVSLKLSLSVSAVSVDGQPVDVQVLFGSVQHPSRVSFGVSALPAGAETGSRQVTYYLADHGFSLARPDGASVGGKRASESSAAQLVRADASWSWGKTTLAAPFKADGDAIVTVFIGPGDPSTAAVMRGFRAIVVLQPPTGAAIERHATFDLAGTSGVYQAAASVPVPVGYTLGLNMSGVDVPAGTTLEVRFITFSTSDPTAMKLYFHYGTSDRPASLQFIVKGGAAPPTSTSSSSTSSKATSSASKSSPATSSSTSVSATASVGSDDAGSAKAGLGANVKDIDPPADVPAAGALAMVAAVGAIVVVLRRRT